MNKELEVGVIGLGKFGLQFGVTLVELGHKVVGLDSDPVRVRAAQNVLTQVYEANAVEKDALTQLRFQDLDAVAVSVGGHMENSILVTLNLQELGVGKIIVKAVSDAHSKILRRIGAHHVIQPEADVAVHTAHRLNSPGLLDVLPIGGGVLVQELIVNAWEGKTLLDLNLRTQSGVLVAAVRRAAEPEYRFVPDPKTPFAKGDRLLIIGPAQSVSRLTS